MPMRALPPAFDHRKCLLICPFFIVTTFSRLFLFFHHIFIKNINRPPQNKGGTPQPTGAITLQCFVALESLLLLEAALTADTGLGGPSMDIQTQASVRRVVNGCGRKLYQGLLFGGGE